MLGEVRLTSNFQAGGERDTESYIYKQWESNDRETTTTLSFLVLCVSC